MQGGRRDTDNTDSAVSRSIPDHKDDEALLKRVAAKDKNAFEQLYFQYHRKLYQFLLRIVHNPEAAEELLNDVMYVVWNKATTFKGQAKVSTWIFGIAYRKALKEREQTKRRPEASNDAELPDFQDLGWNTCPEEWLASAEFSRVLKQSIASLGAEHRSVVELTALGHTYKEISEVMNCPENTVKTRMFYARRQMKTFFSKALVTQKHTSQH